MCHKQYSETVISEQTAQDSCHTKTCNKITVKQTNRLLCPLQYHTVDSVSHIQCMHYYSLKVVVFNGWCL